MVDVEFEICIDKDKLAKDLEEVFLKHGVWSSRAKALSWMIVDSLPPMKFIASTTFSFEELYTIGKR